MLAYDTAEGLRWNSVRFESHAPVKLVEQIAFQEVCSSTEHDPTKKIMV